MGHAQIRGDAELEMRLAHIVQAMLMFSNVTVV